MQTNKITEFPIREAYQRVCLADFDLKDNTEHWFYAGAISLYEEIYKAKEFLSKEEIKLFIDNLDRELVDFGAKMLLKRELFIKSLNQDKSN